jgi:hypothetical protein
MEGGSEKKKKQHSHRHAGVCRGENEAYGAEARASKTKEGADQ